MNRNYALVLSAAFIAAGFWLGEGGLPPGSLLPATVGAMTCLVVAVVVPGRVWLRLVGGVVAMALYIAAFLGGSFSFDHAFSECLHAGEAVRERLEDYRLQDGRYPARLDQLEGSVPCGRMLRASILEYTATRDGYALSFRDWLVEHTATESAPFIARK